MNSSTNFGISFQANIKSNLKLNNTIRKSFAHETANNKNQALYISKIKPDGENEMLSLSLSRNMKKNGIQAEGPEIYTDTIENLLKNMSNSKIGQKFARLFNVLRIVTKRDIAMNDLYTEICRLRSVTDANKRKSDAFYDAGNFTFGDIYRKLYEQSSKKLEISEKKLAKIQDTYNSKLNKYSEIDEEAKQLL